MEPRVNHLDPTGQKLGRKESSGGGTAVKLEDRVRVTLIALKVRVRGERLKYVKSQLEKNFHTLHNQLQEVERLSRLRDNHASSAVKSSGDGTLAHDTGGLILRSRLALFPENSGQFLCTRAIKRPQICSKLNPGNSDARKIVFVDIARLEAVSRLPSYTAWIFVDRNERMTKDQSIARRRRISYESNGKETFFCLDDEEKVAIQDEMENTTDTRALTESEEFISRMVILEHGSDSKVLETIADFVQVSVVKVESLCKSLPVATTRFGNNDKNRGWQPAIFSVSQFFRRPLQYSSLGRLMQPNRKLQHDDERATNANVEPSRTQKEGEVEPKLPTTLALALDSYDTLFCRRCLVFNCALHDCLEEIVGGVNEIQPPSRLLERDQLKPCSPGCHFLLSSPSPPPPAAAAITATMLDCTSRSDTNNSLRGGIPGDQHRYHHPYGHLRAGDGEGDDNDNDEQRRGWDLGPVLDVSKADQGLLINSHEKKKRLVALKENRVKKVQKNAKKIPTDEFLTALIEGKAIEPSKRRTVKNAESSSDSIVYTHEHGILNVPPLLDGDVLTSFRSTHEGEEDDNPTSTGDQGDGIDEHWRSSNGNANEALRKGNPEMKPGRNAWNRLERDLCEKGIQIFGKNSCLIAQNVLKGCKSCQEIFEYIRKQDTPTTPTTATTTGAGNGNESTRIACVSSKPGNEFRSMELLHHHHHHMGKNRVFRSPKFKLGRKKVAPKFDLGAIGKRIGMGEGSAGLLNALCFHYTPCSCESRFGCGKECPCAKRNMHCEKYCGCFKVCKNRFRGCQCAKSVCDRRNCPCFAAGRECDPDVCRFCRIDCGHGPVSSQECHNMRILQRKKKRLLLAQSNVCAGWGVFTRHPICKNDYIGEYTGELISHSEADRRGRIYDRETSFLFNLNDKLVVDAFRKGNKLKFANHSSSRANCYAKVVLVGGDHRVGIFAKDKIEAGEELLYDYQYEPEIAPLWAIKPG